MRLANEDELSTCAMVVVCVIVLERKSFIFLVFELQLCARCAVR